MKMPTRLYVEQAAEWPAKGRHILAQYDEETIVVYQAYREAIGRYAIEHGVFGGEFSFSRMSWIKPNFLWMMFRSGWGTKEGQEITLGLRRTFFDAILTEAIASTFNASDYSSEDEWRSALCASSGIRTMIRRAHLYQGEQFSWDYEAQCWIAEPLVVSSCPIPAISGNRFDRLTTIRECSPEVLKILP